MFDENLKLEEIITMEKVLDYKKATENEEISDIEEANRELSAMGRITYWCNG